MIAVCVVGMGAHHQVRHDDPEEDEGSAPAVRRLSARHAGQTQEGNRIGRNSSYDVWTSLCPCRLQGVCVCVSFADGTWWRKPPLSL